MLDTIINKNDSYAIGQLTNAVRAGSNKIVDALTPSKKKIVVTIDYDEYENEKHISYKKGRSQGFLNCCLMIAEWKNSGLEIRKYIESTGKYDLIEVLHAFDDPRKYINDTRVNKE